MSERVTFPSPATKAKPSSGNTVQCSGIRFPRMTISINAEIELMALEISQNCFSGEYAISIPLEISLPFQGIVPASVSASREPENLRIVKAERQQL